MKRLQKKLAHLAKKSFYDKRRKRKMIIAEWISSDPSDPSLVQNITDIMASGGQIQVQYNGEYKTILPYGWNSSKEGNVLLMCYKDTGEVRSYRLDRITEVLFDSSNLPISMQMDAEEESLDNNEFDNSGEDDILSLPDETDEFQNEESEFGLPAEQELPFDEALEIMDDEVEVEENQLEDVNTEDSENQDLENEEQEQVV